MELIPHLIERCRQWRIGQLTRSALGILNVTCGGYALILIDLAHYSPQKDFVAFIKYRSFFADRPRGKTVTARQWPPKITIFGVYLRDFFKVNRGGFDVFVKQLRKVCGSNIATEFY